MKKPSIKRDAKKLSKAAKQTKKQVSQIFKTAKTLKKILTKPTKKKILTKPAKKKTRDKINATRSTDNLPPSFKLLNIKQFQGKSWADIMAYASAHYDQLDKLKTPEETFVATIYGNSTEAFRNSQQLFARLNEYVEDSENRGGETDRLIDHIGIVRFTGSPKDAFKTVQDRRREATKRVKEERQLMGAVFGKTKETGKTKTFRDYAFEAMKNLEAANKRAQDADKKINALLSRIAKLEKASKKKAAKKVAKKKATKKVAAKKSTKKVSKKNGTKGKTTTKNSVRTGSTKGKSTSAKKQSKSRGRK